MSLCSPKKLADLVIRDVKREISSPAQRGVVPQCFETRNREVTTNVKPEVSETRDRDVYRNVNPKGFET